MNSKREQLRPLLAKWVGLQDREKQEAWLVDYLLKEKLCPEFFLALLDISNQTRDANPRSQLNIVSCVQLALARAKRPELFAAAHRALCVCYGNAGYQQEALEAVTQALEFYRQLGDDESCGLQIANKVLLLGRASEHHHADQVASENEAYLLKHRKPHVLTNFYWNWATVKQRLQQPAQALELLVKIEPVVKQNDDFFEKIDFDETRASLLLDVGEFQAGLVLLEKSQRILQPLSDEQTLLGHNAFNLALCHYRMGNLYFALQWANRSLLWARLLGPESDDYQLTYHLLGTILLALNQPKSVIAYLGELKQPARASQLTRIQLGELKAISLAHIGKWGEAISKLTELIKFHKERQVVWQSRTRALLAEVYLDWFVQENGNQDELHVGYEILLDTYNGRDSHSFYLFEILILLAQYELAFDRPIQATDWLGHIEQTDLLPPYLKLSYFDLRGQIAEKNDEYEIARNCYEQALEQSQATADHLPTAFAQARFSKQHDVIVNRLGHLLVSSERWDDVWQLIERQRANTLFALGSLPQFLDRPSADPLLDLYYKQRKSYFLINKKLYQNDPTAEPIGLETAARLHYDLHHLAKQMDGVLNQLQKKTVFRARHVSEICQSLEEDSILLTYKRIGSQVAVFGIDAHGWVVQKILPTPWSKIEEALKNLQIQFTYFKGMIDGDAAIKPSTMSRFNRSLNRTQSLLSKLYLYLWDPVASHIGDHLQHLTIVADDALLQLPFSSLYNQAAQSYLIDRYAINYAPSASVYVTCKERAKRQNKQQNKDILVFAHEGHVPAPLKLKHVGAEARAVQAVYKDAQLFLNKYATVEKLKQLADRACIIHIATHGRGAKQQSNPLLCSLQMGGEIQDQAFYVYDLAQLDLRGVDLVCLSGCDTGQAYDEGGHLLGLQWGVFNAGGRLLIGNLAEVHDKITAVLMAKFYQLYGQGVDAAEALRQAQLAIRQAGLNTEDSSQMAWQHPFLWSAFATFGFAGKREA